MSFAAPVYLLLLVLVPLAAGAYVWFDRRRRASAERFASAWLMPSVAPAGPGFRRHLPPLLYAVALAAVALALAKPETTVAVPEERASIVFVTDISGSMQATDVAPSRIVAARSAARELIDSAPEELRIGAVSFNHSVQAVLPPSHERSALRELVAGLRPSGGTATGKGLASAVSMLERREDGPRTPGAVILLSDGASTHGRDPEPVARKAARERIPIYTVALGTDSGTIQVERPDGTTVTRPVPPDRDTMSRLAAITGARTFNPGDTDELATVYERLGSQVAMREEKREVSAAFAGGAALLLLAGGAFALRWFGRLP
jgi:Ca-activated chloride channel family protein